MFDPIMFNQVDYEIRCEWGEEGIKHLAPTSQVLVIVDVLSFSTCVEVATSQGAIVFPYLWKDASAAEYAKSVGAELAHFKRSREMPSLSPVSLTCLSPGTRLVLPSPNGASLSRLTGQVPTVAGCFRNAEVVAQWVQRYNTGITVIPAGERWQNGTLRPALEDWIGAGAILSNLSGTRSPEAEAAIAVYHHFKTNLLDGLRQCGSGKELIARGFEDDVELAAALNISSMCPFFLIMPMLIMPMRLIRSDRV